jgi:hypothetical protein
MSTNALNVFKTVTANLSTTATTIYTAPSGYTAIILMAQISNVTSTTGTVTFIHYNPSTSTTTELLKDFSIPGNDAASATTGKLVVETGNQIKVSASADNKFKIVLSAVESANE